MQTKTPPLIPALAAALVIMFSTTQNSMAVLVVDFYGVPGSGQTTIIFSGSSVATSSDFFRTPGSANNSNMWQDIGSFTNIQDLNFFFNSGSASVSVSSGGSQTISAVYMDNDGGTSDDFTVGMTLNLNFTAGDTISWSGTVTTNNDVNTLFDAAPLPAQFTSSNFAGLSLQLNIFPNAAPLAPVPEPTFVSLAICGLVCLAFKRRHRG